MARQLRRGGFGTAIAPRETGTAIATRRFWHGDCSARNWHGACGAAARRTDRGAAELARRLRGLHAAYTRPTRCTCAALRRLPACHAACARRLLRGSRKMRGKRHAKPRQIDHMFCPVGADVLPRCGDCSAPLGRLFCPVGAGRCTKRRESQGPTFCRPDCLRWITLWITCGEIKDSLNWCVFMHRLSTSYPQVIHNLSTGPLRL